MAEYTTECDAMEEIDFIKQKNGIHLKNESEGDVWVRESAEFRFKDNTFHASYWKAKPAKNPKSLVIIIHGYAEYLWSGYDETAIYLVKNCNSMVFGHDHVGHGRTSGARVQVNSIDEYVDPIIAHVRWMKRQHPGVPCFIIAHSMGGQIALHALFKNQALFRGVAFDSPLVRPNPEQATPIKIFLLKLLQGVWPSFQLDTLDSSLVTRDKAYVKQIDDDKLMWQGGFKARHSWALLNAFDLAQEKMSSLTLPVLAMQGGKDKLVSPLDTKAITDRVSSTSKEYIEYPDAFHNLLIELEDVKVDVLKRIKIFINGHIEQTE